ncbi:MAG: acetate--CoA ligase [archaeon]|nr:MAG: acetate--CoA ligase [archaeon]
MTKWVVKDKDVFWPSEEMKKKANMSDPNIYGESLKDQVSFWASKASELFWFDKWKEAYQEDPPYFKWFVDGKTNLCFNCLDRHLDSRGDRPALIWVPEPPEEEGFTLTYRELHEKVCRFSNVLKGLGVKKGDRVGIYLPMIPETQIALLACARIGAIHTVVFSAFSTESLKDRLVDSGAKILITADGYYRRGKPIELKEKADKGVEGTEVEKVVVVKRLGSETKMKEGRDLDFNDIMENSEPECEPEKMESNENLFILYTSGTTGKPKGIIHDTGGYMVQAYLTTKWIFDLQDDDVFWCTADIGWVTGHTYACYGPLLNGGTMLTYEGSPDYPDLGVWWKIIQEKKISVFYTSPTAVRMFKKAGTGWIDKHDLSSLRLLGSVGEPIDREAWIWYFEKIGGGNCPILDTWWQTETGGILITALPGIGPFIPTVAGKPFPGTRLEVLDEDGKKTKQGQEGYLVQKKPFAPGMLRGVYGNPKKYMDTYWSKYGLDVYYPADGAIEQEGGNIKILGRSDDVMKVAGHRMSTAEMEDAINRHPNIAECAVVSKPDEIKGEVPVAFVILKNREPSDEMKKEIKKTTDKYIGPIARPAEIYFVEDVPKTRSGKIMRRILKNMLRGKDLGNITTLRNPECVDRLKEIIG